MADLSEFFINFWQPKMSSKTVCFSCFLSVSNVFSSQVADISGGRLKWGKYNVLGAPGGRHKWAGESGISVIFRKFNQL